MKRTKRRAVVLSGPDRGKDVIVDRIDETRETCRVAVGSGKDKTRYSLMLDAVDFIDPPDEGSGEIAGLTSDECAELRVFE